MKNLYTLPAVDDGAFENFCGGNLNGEHESCIDVAAIPGVDDAFELRDSKAEGAGRNMRVTTSEVDDFAIGWAKKRGLALWSGASPIQDKTNRLALTGRPALPEGHK